MRRSLPLLKKSTDARGAAIAEFGPVLAIFFLIVLIPLLGLISFMDGMATVVFAVHQAARACGPAITLKSAKESMKDIGDQIIGGPLGAFASLSPRDASKLKLVVLEVPVEGGAAKPFVPGTDVDTSKHFYEYQVTGSYMVNPIFTPQLVKEPMTFTASCSCEHPEGLSIAD